MPQNRGRYYNLTLAHLFSFPVREATPFPVLPSTPGFERGYRLLAMPFAKKI